MPQPYLPPRGADRVSDAITYDTDSPHGLPRRFILVRRQDISGLSGTGVVADGVTWAEDGRTVMRWRKSPLGVRQIAHFDHPREVLAVHGHHGATDLQWIDPAPRASLSLTTDRAPTT